MTNKPLLNDPNVFPSQEVLENTLGKRYDLLHEFLQCISSEGYDLTFEWRFYNDGKSWLGKAEYAKPKKQISQKKQSEVYSQTTVSKAHSEKTSGLPVTTGKKKTIFWLSVWEGYFQTSFFFTEKTRPPVLELEISDTIKSELMAAEPTGKLIPLIIKINKKRQLKDVLKIVQYKKSLN